MNTKIPLVETDEKGNISYGLKSGLYKAIEMEAPKGYELPEKEERHGIKPRPSSFCIFLYCVLIWRPLP